ncbi:hypothetical protein VF21_08465 [Pseudogymnoascus sp. 05NY08]|nr:hypothetical protein VF21_08465 [Pseudogymnoascus sp. 05NY08]
MAGPYTILEQVGHAYRLDLPTGIKIHPVISADKLRKASNDPKLSSFGDIVYPSPLYIATLLDRQYNTSKDLLWEAKSKTLYWAGSTTGSYASDPTWHDFHRQRFVTMVNGLSTSSLSRAFYNDLDTYHVKSTAVIQCTPVECERQKHDLMVQVNKKALITCTGINFSST